MLMAIAGKAEGKAKSAAKETKRPARQRNSGFFWRPVEGGGHDSESQATVRAG